MGEDPSSGASDGWANVGWIAGLVIVGLVLLAGFLAWTHFHGY